MTSYWINFWLRKLASGEVTGSPGPQGPPGDTGPQGPAGSFAAAKTAILDFGSIPSAEKTFYIDDAALSETSKVISSLVTDPATTDPDENEMDFIDIRAVPLVGQLWVSIRGREGSLHDKFMLTYLIG